MPFYQAGHKLRQLEQL